MVDPVLIMLDDTAEEDPFSLSLARKKYEDSIFGAWKNEATEFPPIILTEGTGLFIGRHGYSGMGDYYSNTHGNTGQGWF